jgi:hypothetical protein
MNIQMNQAKSIEPTSRIAAGRGLQGSLRLALGLAALSLPAIGQAVEFGPFSLNGFAKVEFSRASKVCGGGPVNNLSTVGDPTSSACQLFPGENRERPWADALVIGREYGTRDGHITLAQPYLGVKFDLPKGFKLQGLLSQRWRDGKIDIPGIWYERNVALTHEDYGSIRIGAFPTRAWGFADFPFAGDFGGGDTWASTGAGYGLNTKAIRYTARALDVYEGDLVLEVTYDQGDTQFKRNKPRFLEFWARYYRGDLKLDAMYQDARNGPAVAWGHAPFTGVFYDAKYDAKIGSSGQSMAMLMGRYPINSNFEVGAGVRHNRWSGAYAVCIDFIDGQCRYNNFFNVDFFGKDGSGVGSPGYAVSSNDFTVGLRYVNGPWSANTGLVYLSKARTDNPSERGQGNSLLRASIGGGYDFGKGLTASVGFSTSAYGQQPQTWGCNIQKDRPANSCTLAPRSAPDNNVGGGDARVSRYSHGASVGLTYSF